MGIVMGPNQYGKAEVRVVAVNRDTPRHQVRDLTVSSSLRGDLGAVHYVGDNGHVLPTDTQKNTIFAFAKQGPIGAIEDFALRLARHFVASGEAITGARVHIDELTWERMPIGAEGHDHSFSQANREKRSVMLTLDDEGVHVVSGLQDLVVLKSTGSEFWGYPKDEYTTLVETDDRMLATTVNARWRYVGTDVDWNGSFTAIRSAMLDAFANTHSYALQQTLYHMGKSALQVCPEVAEARLSLPNKHHFVVDLEPFGLDNKNEVFFSADRPYGLIEGAVQRDDAEPVPRAWAAM